MNTATVTAPEIALAPAQEKTTQQNVRRVSDAPEHTVANDAAFFQADDEHALEAHRPMRGILLGVVLGALCWAGIIALIMAM